MLALLAEQALQLVDLGVSESFLICALRDQLTKLIDESSDVGSINRKRAEMLEEIGEELSPSMVSSLQPMEADEVSGGWALQEFWVTASTENLSDGLIDDWYQLRLRRLYLQSQTEQ